MHDKNDPFADGVWTSADFLSALHHAGILDINRYFGCLFSHGAIDDELRELLMRTAVSMVCLKQTRGRIKNDACEGGITTSFSHGSLDVFRGIKFECKVDKGTTTIKASFLIGNALLDRFRDARWLYEDQDDKSSLKTSYFN